MQRSISNQNNIELLAYIVFFIIYSSLATVYPLLPPLLSVLFVFFIRALDKDNLTNLLIISFCLVIFEANNGYILFSTILYFYAIYRLVLPKIKQNISCPQCIKVSYVFLSYLGYYLTLLLLSNIFLQSSPQFNYYIVYYIVIELFLVTLL